MATPAAIGVMIRALALAAVGAALAVAPAQAAPPPSILSGTLAEMTYVELDQSARNGAVALWAIGAIEEHGPHLPLATDVHVPSDQLGRVRERLSGQGIRSVTVPPYYWGVNRVTGAFPGSIDIRPEVMVELMTDVFRSLAKAGFKDVYCITGHYDAAHGKAIIEAIRRANRDGRIRAHFVVPAALGHRLGLTVGEPGFLLAEVPAGSPPAFPDLHAGDSETSMMLRIAPDAVRTAIIPTLKPTDLSADQVAIWRKGYEDAKAVTPDGYLGAPSQASAARGEVRLAAEAGAYAEAIETDLRARGLLSPASRPAPASPGSR